MPAKTVVKTRKSGVNKAVNIGPVTSELESATSSQLAMAKTVAANPTNVDAHRQKIAAAAYRRAESRGFVPGAELDDWLQAEAEVDGSWEDAARTSG
jgi:hypothetical protein